VPFNLPWRIALIRSVVFSLMLLFSARSEAQGSEPSGYRVAINEALAEYKAGHFEEARALFAEAHGIYPNARTLRGLGMTAYELRRYRESIEYLDDALASPVKPLDGRLRTETESLLSRAYRFVARLRLVLTPPNTLVGIDGHPGTPAPEKPLLLEPGLHRFEFTAEGHHSETRELDVKGREIITWTIQLATAPPPPPPPVVAPAPVVPDPAEVAAQAEQAEQAKAAEVEQAVAPAEAPAPRRPVYKNPWLWTGLGIGVAAIAVGVGVAVARDSQTQGKPVTTERSQPNGIIAAQWGVR
jgi:tetratricopeptide (TPR) repeat protein